MQLQQLNGINSSSMLRIFTNGYISLCKFAVGENYRRAVSFYCRELRTSFLVAVAHKKLCISKQLQHTRSRSNVLLDCKTVLDRLADGFF